MFLVGSSDGSSHEMCIRPRPDQTTVPLSLAPALCLCCLQQAAAGICKAVVDVNFYSVNKSHTEWGGFVGGKWQGKQHCKRACRDWSAEKHRAATGAPVQPWCHTVMVSHSLVSWLWCHRAWCHTAMVSWLCCHTASCHTALVPRTPFLFDSASLKTARHTLPTRFQLLH